MIEGFNAALAERGIVADPAQLVAAMRLQKFYDGVSLNDAGYVAFVGETGIGEALWVGTTPSDTHIINPQFEGHAIT